MKKAQIVRALEGIDGIEAGTVGFILTLNETSAVVCWDTPDGSETEVQLTQIEAEVE